MRKGNFQIFRETNLNDEEKRRKNGMDDYNCTGLSTNFLPSSFTIKLFRKRSGKIESRKRAVMKRRLT